MALKQKKGASSLPRLPRHKKLSHPAISQIMYNNYRLSGNTRSRCSFFIKPKNEDWKESLRG